MALIFNPSGHIKNENVSSQGKKMRWFSMANEWFQVGKIVNTHGIAGEVRVISETDFQEERFTKGSILYIKKDQHSTPLPYIVESHRKHKQFDLLKFKDHPTINDVESLKGTKLYVNKEQLTPLGENEFYYHEIIGCEVFTESGELIGQVKEILSPGANDVWVVKTKDKDVLLPYIEEVVKEINIENRSIVIHVMDGLIE